jgi:tricorn protease
MKLLLGHLVLAASLAAQEEARLLRFPHIQGDRIAFVHGGDVWTASAWGGEARRLTSFDQGYELSPRISPDGRWVAFSGEYGGSRQVFVVPYEGGVPRQVTFYPDVGVQPPRGGYDNLVLDWTPDGSKILIRANRTPYGERIGRYFLVDPQGRGIEEPLQIPEGGPASFSPDGQKLAYNIISREWRTWKRYRGGRAQDVWIYDLAQNHVVRITDFEGTDSFPMWLGERIYFTSDRTGTLNLYAYDLGTRQTRAITDFTEYDVLFPARGEGGVIFECGGYLYVMNGDEEVRKLRIRLADDKPWRRQQWKAGEGAIADFDVSPSAKRAVVEVRGELLSVPAEQGEARTLTRTPQRREREPRWSPDGAKLCYLAEVGDDYELFVRDVDGGAERQVTRDTGAWILGADWSPDSSKLAWTDKRNRLMVLDVASGESRQLDRCQESAIDQVAWSPDSAWLAYVKSGPNTFDSIWLCSVDGKTTAQLTSDRYEDGSPTFDPEGRYLYFASARDFRYGELDFEQRLYALLLQQDAAHPLAPRSDEETAAAEKAAPAEKVEPAKPERTQKNEPAEKTEKTAKAAKPEATPQEPAKPETAKAEPAPTGADQPGPKPVRIDLDGLPERLVALPPEPGRYRSLHAVRSGLLFAKGDEVQMYDLEKRKAETVLKGVSSYRLAADGKSLLYRHGGGLCLAKAAPGQKTGEGALPLDGVRVRVEPGTEWVQMYTDAWRLMRDWFYDPAMHGVDWRAMRDKYQPLVAHVAHRDDLDFVLGELIGELNCGHAYVESGESPRVERVPVGLLGCEFRVDNGRYRIASIFDGEGWHERTRCPLREPGVDAKAGDYLLAIDGEDLAYPGNPYRLLENKVGRQVTLRLAADHLGAGARDVVVRPVGSERELRYLTWVNHNRAIVDAMSGGRIGYMHVPDTALPGHRALFEGFRPLARSVDALIIDDRYNGGGSIPDRMIEALGQPVLNYWSQRHRDLGVTPAFAFEGPRAMLINGYSSSGGDAFPYYFRKLGLGKLVGTRTWGGLIGYSSTPNLVDGGGLSVPAFAFVNTDGQWDVEGVGVSPDIEVFDDPTLIQAGREPLLEAAVRHLLRELEERPTPPRPPTPPGPQRAKGADSHGR